MGFDTTVILNNDMLGDIERDPTFGKLLAKAVLALPGSDGPVSVGHGVYVVESHDSEVIAVISVGDRQGKVLGTCAGTTEVRDILNALAARYDLKLLSTHEWRELNAKPTLTEVKEWAELLGHRLVKDDGPIDEEEEAAIDAVLGVEEPKLNEQTVRDWAAKNNFVVVSREAYEAAANIHQKPTVFSDSDARDWAEKNDFVIMSKDDYQHALKKGRKPSLKEVKELAKEYGWRCIVLRRKAKSGLKNVAT